MLNMGICCVGRALFLAVWKEKYQLFEESDHWAVQWLRSVFQ